MQYSPAMWRAKYHGCPARVKSTERHSVCAHELLAGCSPPEAPKLYFAEEIVGGIWMIVMERLKEMDAEDTFPDRAISLSDVKAALDVLHKEELVFGDLRRPNIMVQLEVDVYRAKPIDFDNSGQEVTSGDPIAADEDSKSWYDCFLGPGFPQGMRPSKPIAELALDGSGRSM
ncbi:hypothetical protein BOTBODRAFT_177785 [Botryobasidium botryosum FD-172 SS1]|uniref:Protein kinase domain-containing protein n=1 Tax=Botryobasidium botryosum (strain FD-172 SS1) TaxID=930990 RepID=A0A067MGA9_BOTB1|nr:hypothetical protein BOTBODRAFT_177785 [Botryobasidium botryosum FD-172 SS1]